MQNPVFFKKTKKTIHSPPALRELLFATNQRYLNFIASIRHRKKFVDGLPQKWNQNLP